MEKNCFNMKSFSEYTTGMLKSDVISKKISAIAQMSFHGTKEAEALEIKMGLILRLIQSIRLQSPSNHTGLVIAFTSITEIPFPSDIGVKFSWYRVKGVKGEEGEEKTLIEDSLKAFYLPTIDDVGCKICVRCDDDFDQGLSRHLETTFITLDPALQILGESLLKERFYKVSDSGIFFSPEIKESKDVEGTCFKSKPPAVSSLILSGMTNIEVDTGGIFIQLPVSG
jgi:hypothetical protein